MNLLERVNGARAPAVQRAFEWPWPGDTYGGFAYSGGVYYGPISGGVSGADREVPKPGFSALADAGFRQNAVVFGAETKRISVFSEARFLWRGFNKGRPGNLFSDDTLSILERPWPRGTTSDLLAEMLMYADIGGNAFVSRTPAGTPDRLRVMRPDWVTIVMGDTLGRPVETPAQLDCEIIGFIYNPADGSTDPEPLLVDEVCHWVPPGQRDPLARFRGMSWLTPAIRELQADQAATMHKLMFFENGGTPQLVVSFNDPQITPANFQAFVQKMDDKHAGWRNAYKTLYLGSGADVNVVGRDLQQLDFNNSQGRGETRIALAAGIHPVLLGISEGLGGAALNAGNFESARRSTADMLFRPLWRSVCGALQDIVPPPTSSSELWYDEAFIPFLQEDRQAAAEIVEIRARTISNLVKEGFTWQSAVAAVDAEDVTLLKHTGLVSVQLQPLTAAKLEEPRFGLEPGKGGTPPAAPAAPAPQSAAPKTPAPQAPAPARGP